MQKFIKKILIKVTEVLVVRRSVYRRGSAWWDISQGLVDIILKEKEWIYGKFNKYKFPDEAFVQTLIAKHNLTDTVCDNKHYADWERSVNGSPYVFRKEDYDKLMNIDSFFARKFDETIDSEIIEMIYQHILDADSLGDK